MSDFASWLGGLTGDWASSLAFPQERVPLGGSRAVASRGLTGGAPALEAGLNEFGSSFYGEPASMPDLVLGAGDAGPQAPPVPFKPQPPPPPPSRQPVEETLMGPPAPSGGVDYRQLPGGNINVADMGPQSLYWSGEDSPSITASVDRSQGLGGADWLADQRAQEAESPDYLSPQAMSLARLSDPSANGPHEGTYSFTASDSIGAREAELEELGRAAAASRLQLAPLEQRAAIAQKYRDPRVAQANAEAQGRIEAAKITAAGGVARERARGASQVSTYSSLHDMIQKGYDQERLQLEQAPGYTVEQKRAMLADLAAERDKRLLVALSYASGNVPSRAFEQPLELPSTP